MSRLRVVEPAGATRIGAFEVLSWPPIDGRPGELIAMRLPLPVATGARYLRNGWQSWSGASIARLGDPAPRVASELAARHPYPAVARLGNESYDVFAAEGYVAGVLNGGAMFLARPVRGELLAVREAPGPHPAVWIADASPEQLLDHCTGRTGQPALRGASTWSGYRRRVDEGVIAEMCRRAGEFPGMQVISIDDGWAAAVGDWDHPAAGFRHGIGAAAAMIADAGYQPGLWLAPFLASARSRVAVAHPEWLLRSGQRAPVVAFRDAQWGGDVDALDVTRPDVLAWLTETVAGVVASGFRYLKLDFLYAAALPGRCHVPETAERRVRSALRVLRQAAGPRAYLVASGCPLWPAMGLVDAMRVGPDVGDTLTAPSRAGEDASMLSGLRNAMRSVVLRRPFHERLWINDPDAVQLAPTMQGAVVEPRYLEVRRRWAERVAASGEMLFWSDRLTDIDAEGLMLWRRLAATHARSPAQDAATASHVPPRSA